MLLLLHDAVTSCVIHSHPLSFYAIITTFALCSGPATKLQESCIAAHGLLWRLKKTCSVSVNITSPSPCSPLSIQNTDRTRILLPQDCTAGQGAHGARKEAGEGEARKREEEG